MTEAMSATAAEGRQCRLKASQRRVTSSPPDEKPSLSQILDFIRGHHRELTDADMAARLGLTLDQVRGCMRKLGLTGDARAS